jgi:hypothetical protein
MSKTQAQLDRATDLRLQKAYGISLREYEVMLYCAGGGCQICGKPPGSKRLHVDHDHGWKKVKIVSKKYPDAWNAKAVYHGKEFNADKKTKSTAIRDIRIQLKRASVRGILCAWCNRGLRYYRDTPELMQNAAAYLRKHQGVSK